MVLNLGDITVFSEQSVNSSVLSIDVMRGHE